MLNIVILVGTTRNLRKTIHAAKIVYEVGKEFSDLDIKFVDVADFYPFKDEGNDKESRNPKWVELNKWADAYFIVAPEYNHSFPGSLKMLLDSDLGNYTHKAVNLAGVSSGSFGGARMIENILAPLREMGFVVTFSDVFFPNINELLEDTSKIENQKQIIRKSYSELIWLAKALKWGRENL